MWSSCSPDATTSVNAPQLTRRLRLGDKLVVDGDLLLVLPNKILVTLALGTAAKGPDSSVVDFRQRFTDPFGTNITALVIQTARLSDSPSEKRQSGSNLLRLEVAINLRLAGRREPVLGLVVAIAKVVAMAGRSEGEPERVVGRGAAPIRVPDEGRRVPGIAAAGECGECDAIEILVGDLAGALPLDKRSIGREGQHGRCQAEDACNELHGDGDEGWGSCMSDPSNATRGSSLYTQSGTDAHPLPDTHNTMDLYMSSTSDSTFQPRL